MKDKLYHAKLPPLDMRDGFTIQMKFYWARRDPTRPIHEQMLTGGVISKVPGTKLHPLFLDYDRMYISQVKTKVKKLIKKYKLGDAYLFSSVADSFHVKFFYDWLGFSQMSKIVKSVAEEPGYQMILHKQGHTTLRTCSKWDKKIPEYRGKVASPYQKYKTKRELDWGDMLRMTVFTLLDTKHFKMLDFRKGEIAGFTDQMYNEAKKTDWTPWVEELKEIIEKEVFSKYPDNLMERCQKYLRKRVKERAKGKKVSPLPPLVEN
jgi:hypothetical protein